MTLSTNHSWVSIQLTSSYFGKTTGKTNYNRVTIYISYVHSRSLNITFFSFFLVYLFRRCECLQTSGFGHHGVTVSWAGLQRQSQTWDGMDSHLCDGNFFICDWEGRLSKDSFHGQRRLHLQRRRGKQNTLSTHYGFYSVWLWQRDAIIRVFTHSFIVSLQLMKPVTRQFWIKVLCAGVCCRLSTAHMSMSLRPSQCKTHKHKENTVEEESIRRPSQKGQSTPVSFTCIPASVRDLEMVWTLAVIQGFFRHSHLLKKTTYKNIYTCVSLLSLQNMQTSSL